MHIKIPKRKSKMAIMFDETKAGITKGMKVTTRKGQIVRAIVVCTISIALIIAFIVLVVNMRSADTFSTPDNTKAKYLNEKNSGKIKATYNNNEKKEQFLTLAKDIELRLANYYINTTTETNSFNLAVDGLNGELKKSEWKTIDMGQPKEWIGEWSVDERGAIQFKFLNKKMEPNWINDEDVSKYIIKN